jgi:transcriptional regulator with XRE-family HTH domain
MRINPVPIFLKIMDLDMTREEAAARAKIGRGTLQKIERGQMVYLKSIKRLCLSLGVPTKEVLIDAGSPTQTERSEVLGDRGRAEEDQHGNDSPRAGRASVRELLPARKRDRS